MEPTKILSSEHRVIEIVLSCLERLTETALLEKRLDRQLAEEAIDFIRNFADKCHHGKEEGHLFPAMVEMGIPKDGGPVGQMLQEHEQGRAFVKGMAETVAAASNGEAAALKAFSANSLGYVELLRAHIHKEDHILFPMADRVLSSSDQKQLLETFERVESEHMGQGTHDKYIKIAETLAKRFGVSMDGIPNNSCGCGH